MALKISTLNLLAAENSKAHKTHKFEAVHLKSPTPIFRRGQEFEFDITFSNRQYNAQSDKLRVLLHYEDEEEAPRAPRGGAWITDSPDILEDLDVWSLRIISNKGKTLKLKMRSPIRIPIGCWKMEVKTDLRNHLARETYQHPESIYILLNPWHKDDLVYMPDQQLLEEYVMNDIGKVYVGAKGAVKGRHWLFGQFEAHVLPIVRELLKKSDLDYHEKADPIQLSRFTFQTHSLLVGNWIGDFEDGTLPSLWTGSAPILKEYSKTGVAVKYGQCWVFASIACSLCRAIGLPARVVTNIVSAMDYDESLTIDKFFDIKGEFLSFESESLWDFHAWTDVWMARKDLPSGFGGWQAIDATYSLGPASLEAVKRGEVGLLYDVPRIISEVNADVIDWKEDEESIIGFKKVKINTDYVGYQMLTKRPYIFDPNGERDREDVINQYKNPEGTKEERLALYNAAFKCSNRSCEVFELEKAKEIEEIEFNIPTLNTISVGKNFSVVLNMKNKVNEKRNVQIAVTVLSLYYNGVKAHTIKSISDTIEIGPNSQKQFNVEITVDDYIGKLVEFSLLKTYIMATVEKTNQIWSGEDDLQITKPNLIIESVGPLKIHKSGKIVFKLKNPLKTKLTECKLAFDCPGLVKYQKFPFRNISPVEDVKIETNVTPSLTGKLTLIAVFNCKEIHEIMGTATIEVV